MSDNKIDLNKLKVSSFVTTFSNGNTRTIKGGEVGSQEQIPESGCCGQNTAIGKQVALCEPNKTYEFQDCGDIPPLTDIC